MPSQQQQKEDPSYILGCSWVRSLVFISSHSIAITLATPVGETGPYRTGIENTAIMIVIIERIEA